MMQMRLFDVDFVKLGSKSGSRVRVPLAGIFGSSIYHVNLFFWMFRFTLIYCQPDA